MPPNLRLVTLEDAYWAETLSLPSHPRPRRSKGLVRRLTEGIVRRLQSKHPTEETEHRMLAQWLDAKGLVWCHPSPNAYRAALRMNPHAAMRAGIKAKQMGVKAGIPDFLIFSVPQNKPYRGVALELKRLSGAYATPAQLEWLEDLERCGWMASVCYGGMGAIKFLQGLGY